FADQAQGLALAQREAHAVHGAHHTPARVEVGAEASDLQHDRRVGTQQTVPQTCRRRGSSQSRSQSPNRLKASTTSMMAAPGTTESHHALAMWLRPSATICPQDGVGGGIPAPRKESEATTMMTKPMCRDSSTINVFKTFGTMWMAMMRRCEHPWTRANATKSRAFTARTSPRTTRAKRAQIRTVM